ncbi:pilus assembly protein PilQ [Candidatus Tenderia electrophaga]|uniref:Pilus assembly protein PilQ n=1 Tax=Candidatus Tenderia electrophaga TaxID=1748243 RepID=A0A0S2TG97_9GAMM|nr:pilus assembly protein PilQ [Candidatus Tenderia electrophaga]
MMQRLVLLACLLLGLLTVPAHAQEADGENALETVDVSSLPGNRVQIKFSMAKAAEAPLSFTIDNPARIALDFPATSNNLDKRTTQVGVGVARSVSAVEARGRTRVVLNLVRLVPYETRVEGNNVYVILDSAGAAASMASPPVDKDPTVFTSREISASHSIKGVDFRRGEEGEGRILVSLSDAGTSVNIQEQGGKLALDFIDTSLPAELEQRLDVTDFATPVTLVDTFRQGNNVRMVISAQDNFEHLAYQSGDLLTVEIKESIEPTDEELRRQGDESVFTGERLSLNFQDIEVRAVLQLIADFTGMNLVTSDSVTGSVTLRLQNVPWDQALDIILKTKGLGMRKTGNLMFIAPAEEIAAREKAELAAKQQIQELEPLYSEMIQINYAKASEIAALLKGEKNSLLSTRGSVTIDARTNTLLVQDTAASLDEIHKMIARLDIPVRQVLIESRIVIANSTYGKEVGSRFGVSRDSMGTNTTGDGAQFSGTLEATDQLVNNDTLTAPGRLNVNLPVASAAGSFAMSFVKLPFGTNVDLELSAMQAEGQGEVVSSPRVITANQKEANIKQGVEIAYQEASSSGATSTSFKEAVLELRVTPQITPDDRIIMDLEISKDSVGDIFQGVPSINTRTITTQVLVENGETVVLGGVYEQSTNDNVTKVPFLGDLPLIGVLFRNTTKTDDKEELLVFITPKIIKEGLSIN